MKTVSLKGFSGIDLRNVEEASDPTTLRVGINVDPTVGKGWQARSQLRLWTTLDSSSVGLYAVGGQLRSAVPFRIGSALPRPPAGVVYDYLNNRGANGYDAIAPLHVTAVSAWFSNPYIVVQRTGLTGGAPAYEHHYLGASPVVFTSPAAATASDTITLSEALSAELMSAGIAGATVRFAGAVTVPTASFTVVSVTDSTHIIISSSVTLPANTSLILYQPAKTKVSLPFEPGPAMIVHADRVWAGSLTDRTVPYSTTTDPTNWTDPEDAGFLSTATHLDGDQPINGLSVFRNQICVFYARNIQVWNTELRDPASFAMVDSVGGAGTKFPRSIANMMGDLMYFSEGGYRLLSAVITTGQVKDGDIGMPIQDLTRVLATRAPSSLVSLWSPSRAQYLCAAGSQVFVLTNSPLANLQQWSTYQLPWEVEALVELNGQVYVRRAGTAEIYIFDPAATGESGFSWRVRHPFHDYPIGAGGQQYFKQFKFITLRHVGQAALTLYTDGDLTAPLGNIDVDSAEISSLIPLHVVGNTLSLEFSGTGPYRLDEVLVRFDVGNLL